MIDKKELTKTLSRDMENKSSDKKKVKEDLAKEVIEKLQTADEILDFINILKSSLFKGLIL